MNFLQKINIFSAILGVTLFIMGVMVTPSIIVYSALRDAEKQVHEFDTHTVSRMSAFADFSNDFNRLVISTYEYIVMDDEVARIRIKALQTQAQESMDAFLSLSQNSPQEQEIALQLREVFNGQTSRLMELATAYETGQPRENLYVYILNIRSAQIRSEETIHNKIDALVSQERQRAIYQIDQLNSLLKVWFLSGVSFSVLLSSIFAFMFARVVSRSVREAEQVAKIIAAGDLRTPITSTAKNEFGKLMRSLEYMRLNLKSLVDSKDNFMALISHQLRTPLTVLRGNTELLLRASKKDDTIHAHVDELKSMSGVTLRLIRLVNDIIVISKASAETDQYAQRTDIDISSVVSSIFAELQIEARKVHVDLQHVCSLPTPPIVHVNEDAIRHVLSNLIENAIKYSAPANLHNKNKAHVEVRYVKHDNSIEIQIEDTGVGIPKKDQSHVFEKFFRASNVAVKVANGSGLGLFLVKLIVDRIGGIISFTSAENVGTTFCLVLPSDV